MKQLMRAVDIQVVDPKNAWRERHYGSPNLREMKVRITEADWAIFEGTQIDYAAMSG